MGSDGGAVLTRIREKELCRYVRHYQAKNGYAPALEMIGTQQEREELRARCLVLLVSLYEGGPPVKVVLTAKGMRLATS